MELGYDRTREMSKKLADLLYGRNYAGDDGDDSHDDSESDDDDSDDDAETEGNFNEVICYGNVFMQHRVNKIDANFIFKHCRRCYSSSSTSLVNLRNDYLIIPSDINADVKFDELSESNLIREGALITTEPNAYYLCYTSFVDRLLHSYEFICGCSFLLHSRL